MKSWNFPETHQAIARYHHHPFESEKFQLETAIVHMAETIAQIAESGVEEIDFLKDVDSSTRKLVDISLNDVETLLVDAREQFIEVLALFRPKGKVKTHNAA